MASSDNRKYLLTTASSEAAFVLKYGKAVDRLLPQYVEWVNNLPMMEWRDPLTGAGASNPEFVIGMICLLYQRKLINISFSDPRAEYFRREPASEQEYLEFVRRDAVRAEARRNMRKNRK